MSTHPRDQLTEEERETFESLRDDVDDEVLVEFCDLVLQSSEDREEAN
jgi:hypothetical protein